MLMMVDQWVRYISGQEMHSALLAVSYAAEVTKALDDDGAVTLVFAIFGAIALDGGIDEVRDAMQKRHIIPPDEVLMTPSSTRSS